MQIGGYQIIDLKGKNFVLGVGMVYDGIYDLIEGTRKPIYVSGISIAGKEYNDCYVDFAVNETNYEGTIYGNKITISDKDVVTISAAS